MSDIKVGDLVQVVHPVECGCVDTYMGHIFVVPHIRASIAPRCMDCRAKTPAGMVAVYDGCLFSMRRLKKIPPLEELNECTSDSSAEA